MVNAQGWTDQNHFEWKLENLKGAIQLAAQTIKSLEIANGGGAIGVLTFYGNALVGRNLAVGCKGYLLGSLVAFGGGIFFAVMTSLLAYVAQRIVATDGAYELRWFYCALATAFLSVFCFLAGVLLAGLSF